MCFCGDAESPDFFSETFPKARKEHRCCECGSPIPKGEKYRRVSGKWDGSLDTFITCLTCDAWREALMEAEKKADPENHCTPPFTMLWECIDEFCHEVLGYRTDPEV